MKSAGTNRKTFAFIAEKLGVELTETEDNLTLENIDTVNGAEGVTTLGRTRFDRALLTAVKERGVNTSPRAPSAQTTSTSPPQRSSASRCATQLRAERRGRLHRHAHTS